MKRTSKRVLAVLLAMLLAAGALPLSASAESTGFSDVSETSWYYPAVNYAVENNLFAGTGNNRFSPDDPMTRGMFVTVLGRLSQVNKTSYPVSYFRDVKTSQYYSPYVQWAASYEVVSGTGNYRYNPDAAVTRQELASMLYRCAQATGNDVSLDESVLAGFTDAGWVSSWAKSAMAWAVAHGVLNGNDGYLMPQHPATRAQVAQIFKNSQEVLTETAMKRAPIQLTEPPMVFNPVPLKQLDNYKVFASKMNAAQFQQAYDICVELMAPAVDLDREQQLAFVSKAVSREYLKTEYTSETEHYGDPYGVLVEKKATCSGCTRTVGMCLNILGIQYEHVNEGEWTHQWARVNLNGTWWVVDGDGYGMCYKEPVPYEHPGYYLEEERQISPAIPGFSADIEVSWNGGSGSASATGDIADGEYGWFSRYLRTNVYVPEEPIVLRSLDDIVRFQVKLREGHGPLRIQEQGENTPVLPFTTGVYEKDIRVPKDIAANAEGGDFLSAVHLVDGFERILSIGVNCKYVPERKTLGNGKAFTPENVEKVLSELRRQYPEGSENHGTSRIDFMIKDALFADTKNGERYAASRGKFEAEYASYDSIRVGDRLVIDIEDDSTLWLGFPEGYQNTQPRHSREVFVLGKTDDALTVAWQGYMGTVHWDTQLSREELERTNYIIYIF